VIYTLAILPPAGRTTRGRQAVAASTGGMNGMARFAPRTVLVTVLAGLTLIGCGFSDHFAATRTATMGPGMRPGADRAGGQWTGPGLYQWNGDQWTGPGMMNGQMPGYRFSQPTCTTPQNLPGTVVTVMVGDMGMSRMMSGDAPRGSRMMLHALPPAVPHGRVSLLVQNMGWRLHEVVVLPLAKAATAGQRAVGADGKVDETGSLGEVSASCTAGAGEGITTGSTGWVTLDLPVGRYELVCNMPNHYAGGMNQELDVT
jgi:uncharacterized cupredoxin-like copper-binding protein